MGIYIYISNEDRINKRKCLDKVINDEFQEALKSDPSLMIEQYERKVKSGLLRHVRKTFFNIYHESPTHDGSAYQARLQTSASGERIGVIAYLHGIINGARAKDKPPTS